MIQVKATREGLVGGETASGWIIDAIVPYVALPATAALHQWIIIKNPLTNKTCRALVLDVGPWNTDDDAYVFQEATSGLPGIITTVNTDVRPQAESGTDTSGRPTNKAGIDLGEKVWNLLGMTDNGEVMWEFAV